MIPSIIMTLETFPLTSHGKIDRRALPNPDFSYEYTPPVTLEEMQLCTVWQKML